MSDPLLSKKGNTYMVNGSEKSDTNHGGAFGQPVMMPEVLAQP
jgi:hypothetical protein